MQYSLLHNKKESQKGITLFLAIIITATLLLISSAIITLAVKESFLSASSRESQYAFYAADSGSECALYWDVKNAAGYSAFATSSPQSLIACFGNSSIPLNRSVDVKGNGTTTFNFQFPSDPYCGIVSVSKTTDGRTKIESLGYNTCVANNPRKVERAVRITY